MAHGLLRNSISSIMIASLCHSFSVNSFKSVVSRGRVGILRERGGSRLLSSLGAESRSTAPSTQGASSSSSSLEWESFEFGDSPKWDKRFGNNGMIANTDSDLKEMQQHEDNQDVLARDELNTNQEAWEQLDPDLVERATQVLLPFIQEARVARIKSVLEKRTSSVRLLFENPANPSNIWACLRTIDSFGIQHVDMVVESGQYKGKAALSQKRGMRTAMGSARWLTLHNHATTTDAVRELQSQGCKVIASDLSPDSKDIRDIDWKKEFGNSPICLVMGNEERGISEEMRGLADATFTLPMYGFAESFNLSVATAITLAHLSAGNDGPFRRGDLPNQQMKCLLLKGIINSFPKRRTVDALLRQNDIKLPSEMRLL